MNASPRIRSTAGELRTVSDEALDLLRAALTDEVTKLRSRLLSTDPDEDPNWRVRATEALAYRESRLHLINSETAFRRHKALKVAETKARVQAEQDAVAARKAAEGLARRAQDEAMRDRVLAGQKLKTERHAMSQRRNDRVFAAFRDLVFASVGHGPATAWLREAAEKVDAQLAEETKTHG